MPFPAVYSQTRHSSIEIKIVSPKNKFLIRKIIYNTPYIVRGGRLKIIWIIKSRSEKDLSGYRCFLVEKASGWSKFREFSEVESAGGVSSIIFAELSMGGTEIASDLVDTCLYIAIACQQKPKT